MQIINAELLCTLFTKHQVCSQATNSMQNRKFQLIAVDQQRKVASDFNCTKLPGNCGLDATARSRSNVSSPNIKQDAEVLSH